MARLRTYNKRAKNKDFKAFMRWLRMKIEEHNATNPDQQVMVVRLRRTRPVDRT